MTRARRPEWQQRVVLRKDGVCRVGGRGAELGMSTTHDPIGKPVQKSL